MKALPDFKDRLHQLLATHSVSSVSEQWDSPNIEVINLLSGWFENLGFSCEIQAIGNTQAKANLIAVFKTANTSNDGGLVLAGHSDTVPFDENKWSSNPLAATEKDNKFYGLGSCDMKGFFSLIIEAVMPLVESGTDLKHPLIVLATADEESSMSGARALKAASLHRPRAAVIGEPTNLKPINMHKSIMMHALKIQGRSGHSSNPALGASALDAMSDALVNLKSFKQELAQDYQNPAFEVASPTMNFGCIHGGDNPNRICSACELHFDFRALPGMKNTEMLEIIKKRLQPIEAAHQVQLSYESLFGGVDAFFQDEQSELIQLCEKLTGHQSQAVAFATEAPFLRSMNIDTVVMGPGSIDQAHQPDEFLALDQIKPGVAILQQMIDHYCL